MTEEETLKCNLRRKKPDTSLMLSIVQNPPEIDSKKKSTQKRKQQRTSITWSNEKGTSQKNLSKERMKGG